MYSFKLADSAVEHAQIHALNYRAFVEEIPQHPPNAERVRVDRFHDENVYAISKAGDTVIGMLAIRGRRPFSLDAKLPDLDAHLPPGRKPCEVRLLAIDPRHRTGAVLPGLLSTLWQYAADHQYDCAVISATTRQLKLYEHIGFEPFGPFVGTSEAQFQPMLITRESFQRHARALPPAVRGETVNLLPGPVAVHPDVAEAFRGAAESHRGASFLETLDELRGMLRALVRAPHVAVLLGSGTLANDCVAAQLTRLGRGLVLSNGEFGERLADHAARMRLDHEHLRWHWGETYDLDRVRRAIETSAAPVEWLWFTACETSCGILNDLDGLKELCLPRGIRVCVDAVSAIGAVPLDLSDVHLASGTSGKALGSYPGITMVFHREAIEPSRHLPRYLDLGLYAQSSVPFTHSSNLVRALHAAVARPRRFEETAALGTWLRARLQSMGLELVGHEPAPHVVTIALPDAMRSEGLARSLETAGFVTAWASDYLRARNWIQIAIMGETTRASLTAFLRALRGLISALSSIAPASPAPRENP